MLPASEPRIRENVRVGRSEDGKPLLIAHRGASAWRPEHTLAAYQLAIDMGADVIEPDLVSTRDGVLVARHENEIGATTDVADHPEFASLRSTRNIDGVEVQGWFTEDFTLAELKTLRARERIPAIRPHNMHHDGQFEIPTLEEIIALVRHHQHETGRLVAIYPETKHPSHFLGIGLPLEEALVATLHATGYRGRQAAVYIQSFEVGNLKRLRAMTDLPLVQLLDRADARPWDFVLNGDRRHYADLGSAAGLREIAHYADAVGPDKQWVIPRTPDNQMGEATRFVADAHAAGLGVHVWTLRPENPFLPANLRRGDAASPTERGHTESEIVAYLEAGVDGIFCDDPRAARASFDRFAGRG